MIGNYFNTVERVKALHKLNKLVKQDEIFSDCFLEDIAGDVSIVNTIKAQIRFAFNIVGVPLLCSLETDSITKQSFLVYRNAKTNMLIDRKLWHLPERLKNITYKFLLLWLDMDEYGEFHPEYTFPVVVKI